MKLMNRGNNTCKCKCENLPMINIMTGSAVRQARTTVTTTEKWEDKLI